MRRRQPVQPAGATALPERLAAGPVPEFWPTDGVRRDSRRLAWKAAGEAWSLANGYGHTGWVELLPKDVRPEHSVRRLRCVS